MPAGLVVLGASTGGPRALAVVLKGLQANLPVPVVVVQHIMTGFTGSLAARLNQSVPLEVSEAYAGQRLCAGSALVSPGGQHLFFDSARRIRLGFQPPRHGVRPSIDVTLESAAERFGQNVVAVILTGMGRDGADGALRVKERGGVVLAQDEASCAVFGMPKAVIQAGACDRVLALDAISLYLTGIVRRQIQRSEE